MTGSGKRPLSLGGSASGYYLVDAIALWESFREHYINGLRRLLSKQQLKLEGDSPTYKLQPQAMQFDPQQWELEQESQTELTQADRQVREIIFGNYRIPYFIADDANILILGVFHSDMDIDAYLQ